MTMIDVNPMRFVNAKVYTQAELDARVQQAIADERERAARIIREHRESDKCGGSCWAIITEAIRHSTTQEGR